MSVIVNAELDALLNGALAGSPLSGTLNMHLFQNNITFGAGTILSGLTEATYSSYAPVALAGWGTASGGSGGTSSSVNGAATFAPGVLGTPQTCYGWYITDNAGALLGGDNFASPLVMGGSTIAVAITPTLTLS